MLFLGITELLSAATAYSPMFEQLIFFMCRYDAYHLYKVKKGIEDTTASQEKEECIVCSKGRC